MECTRKQAYFTFWFFETTGHALLVLCTNTLENSFHLVLTRHYHIPIKNFWMAKNPSYLLVHNTKQQIRCIVKKMFSIVCVCAFSIYYFVIYCSFGLQNFTSYLSPGGNSINLMHAENKNSFLFIITYVQLYVDIRIIFKSLILPK